MARLFFVSDDAVSIRHRILIFCIVVVAVVTDISTPADWLNGLGDEGRAVAISFHLR